MPLYPGHGLNIDLLFCADLPLPERHPMELVARNKSDFSRSSAELPGGHRPPPQTAMIDLSKEGTHRSDVPETRKPDYRGSVLGRPLVGNEG